MKDNNYLVNVSDIKEGETYGDITVIKYLYGKNNTKCYLCRCNKCNTKLQLSAIPICRGTTNKCNCNREDLTYKTFGNSVVLGLDHSRPGRSFYKCKCNKCGSEYTLAAEKIRHNMENPNYKCATCIKNGSGVDKSEDMKGKVFGNIQVLGYDGTINGKIYYKVKCIKCGEKFSCRSDTLKLGQSSKCNCKIGRPNYTSRTSTTNSIIGTKIGHIHVNSYKYTDMNGHKMFDCTCDLCGNHYIMAYSNLVSAIGRDDYCCRPCTDRRLADNKRKSPILGHTYGRVRVLSFDHYEEGLDVRKEGTYNTKTEYYKCVCEFCGKVSIISGETLLRADKSDTVRCCPYCSGFDLANDLTGKRFGRLTVTKFHHIDKEKDNNTYWDCKCDCGRECVVRGRSLTSGGTKSCGCLLQELYDRGGNGYKHGMSKTKIYYVWADMKDRCNNPNNKYYYRYGGRGIKVCDRWIDPDNGFMNFYEDMKDTYEEFLTLDRIDNDKDYCKENCRWVSNSIQQNNKSTNSHVIIYGREYTYSEAAYLFSPEGVESSDISRRINMGMAQTEAVFTPKDNSRPIIKPIILESELDEMESKRINELLEYDRNIYHNRNNFNSDVLSKPLE